MKNWNGLPIVTKTASTWIQKILKIFVPKQTNLNSLGVSRVQNDSTNCIKKHMLTPQTKHASTRLHFNNIKNKRGNEGNEPNSSCEDVQPLKTQRKNHVNINYNNLQTINICQNWMAESASPQIECVSSAELHERAAYEQTGHPLWAGSVRPETAMSLVEMTHSNGWPVWPEACFSKVPKTFRAREKPFVKLRPAYSV